MYVELAAHAQRGAAAVPLEGGVHLADVAVGDVGDGERAGAALAIARSPSVVTAVAPTADSEAGPEMSNISVGSGV